ncbi:ATP-binding cassette domain-containing protein [Fournierella massiliensis]|uniref:ABC transporter ATP-binding protein n=1 Tax=Allofournierella massiliensis TaxID=1650663 RepID=UPI00294331BA|nr:ATP-binding cassette domain-containing protein [Fournierella massiliensis]
MTLEAKNLSFTYPCGRSVLQNLALRVGSGERVGIFAPSGRGKTTLCKLLAGYEKPQSGQVLLDGKPLTSYRGYCPVQLIWQHPEQVVDPRLTLGKTLREAGEPEERLVQALGIQPEWLSRYPAELSGGELQRFCIARALGPATRFVLADELSAMLDLATQAQLWSFLVEETSRRGIGLVAVSHSAPLLDRVCTRWIEL